METPAESFAGAPSPPPRIRVGVAGWSYPDWRGTFYPPVLEHGISELRYAAERLDCLEINSTFYRLPEPRLSESWLRRVEDLPAFTFTAKLTRDATHGIPHGAARGSRPPAAAEALRLCEAFRAGIAPLADAGRLGAVVAQFPWYFEDTAQNRELLAAIAEGLRGLAVAVEIRHRSFIDASPRGALPFLERLGLNFVNIDLPRSPSAPTATTINTGPLGYFRLHGRNRDKWFDPQAGRDERYDYLYTQEELEALAPSILRVASRTPTTYVITNNHYRGQAPANAFQLARILTGRRLAVPPCLCEAYPFLADTAALAGPAPSD
jgi:uncharacterized protein YecE (DUF72 family)